jgi:hypothetical protein
MPLCAIPLSAADDTVVVRATRRLIKVLDAVARRPRMSLLAHDTAGRRPIASCAYAETTWAVSSTAAALRRRIP